MMPGPRTSAGRLGLTVAIGAVGAITIVIVERFDPGTVGPVVCLPALLIPWFARFVHPPGPARDWLADLLRSFGFLLLLASMSILRWKTGALTVSEFCVYMSMSACILAGAIRWARPERCPGCGALSCYSDAGERAQGRYRGLVAIWCASCGGRFRCRGKGDWHRFLADDDPEPPEEVELDRPGIPHSRWNDYDEGRLLRDDGDWRRFAGEGGRGVPEGKADRKPDDYPPEWYDFEGGSDFREDG